MIKFFRKIRQKLITEGNTFGYIKYAIGEIFLVVIGILIALGINDWYEDRIDADFENESTGIISITPHITLYLQLEKGIHTIKAISTAGEAIFEQEFEIVDKHWAILGYEYWWGIGEETPPKHFEFIIRTDPIYFE